MKKILLTVCCIFSLYIVSAQEPTFEWAKKMGSTSDDYGQAIAIDKFGNVYITGSFTGTADFDPGNGQFLLTNTSNYEFDIFISKLDAAGNFIWAKKIGGALNQSGNAMTLDKSGNILITGAFEGTVDFNPDAGTFNLSASGYNDIYILKLNQSGNFIWAKNMMCTKIGGGTTIRTDDSGNVYTAGGFWDTADFNPGIGDCILTSNGESDMFISKLDAGGNFIWAKSIGAGWSESVRSLSLNSAGEVYLTGNFYGTIDFNPDTNQYNVTSVGSQDLFILKIGNNGQFCWIKNIGGLNGVVYGNAITLDNSNNIHITGCFSGLAIDFDPDTAGIYKMVSSINDDIFIAKYDDSGNFEWAKSTGGIYPDQGMAIALDDSGNVYSTGYYMGTADFNTDSGTLNVTAVGSSDIYMLKLGNNGRFIWARQMGSEVFDMGYAIAVDTAGSIFTTGYFEGTADFDPGAGTYHLNAVYPNAKEIFVQRINQCPAIDITTSLSGAIIMSNQANAKYQWLDCNNGYRAIAGENAQAYKATAVGRYAVIVMAGNCRDTSACINITSVDIKYSLTASDFIVYPNPANDLLNIIFSETPEEANLEIYNDIGILIQKQTLLSVNNQIDVKTYNRGLYILKVTNLNTTCTLKFIKQ